MHNIVGVLSISLDWMPGALTSKFSALSESRTGRGDRFGR